MGKRKENTKDLQNLLVEESIHGGSASSYHTFEHPFILIEDLHDLHRPIYKEYEPVLNDDADDGEGEDEEGKAKQPSVPKPDPIISYPYLFKDSMPGHCPFYNPNPPSTNNSPNNASTSYIMCIMY